MDHYLLLILIIILGFLLSLIFNKYTYSVYGGKISNNNEPYTNKVYGDALNEEIKEFNDIKNNNNNLVKRFDRLVNKKWKASAWV